MNPTRRTYRILAVAIAQVLTISLSASAQVAAQDGRALDANNRVGGGGYNQRVGTSTVGPNQIIYGNVTGGRQFTGPVPDRDPGAFFGPTPGRVSDRFVAGSSGAPLAYQPSIDLNTPQPFYGSSRAAPPPIGTVREGFTGSYLGTSLAPASAFGTNEFNTDWQSQRLGMSTVLGTRTTLIGGQAGEMYLPGQFDTGNQQSLLSASPLYGIQPSRTGEGMSNDLLSQNGPSMLLPGGSTDRFRFDQAEIRRMRSELQGSAQQPNGADNQQPGQLNNLQQPLEAPDNTSLSNSSRNSFANPALSTNMQTAQATQRLGGLVPPELQSSQYSELRRRLARFQNPQVAALEEQHQAQLARQAAAARRGGAGAATSRPTEGPNLPPPPPSILREPGMATLHLPPVKITSLATGVRAKGLHDQLAGAEDLMRQGKFQSAIDRYNMAQQVVPNNPLIALGRANAELGAGAYLQASVDLHNVFAGDQATLMAEYDLSSWIPAERMSAIRKELADLAARDAKDEMPEFLLAYIAYNTGDAREAARHLSEAAQRAGGKDAVLRLLQTDWKLPQADKPAAPPADLNK